MIYATRQRVTGSTLMLVELKSRKELDALNTEGEYHYKPVGRDYAHRWVKQGHIHETGLYTDEGRIRYAPDDPEGN